MSRRKEQHVTCDFCGLSFVDERELIPCWSEFKHYDDLRNDSCGNGGTMEACQECTKKILAIKDGQVKP